MTSHRGQARSTEAHYSCLKDTLFSVLLQKTTARNIQDRNYRQSLKHVDICQPSLRSGKISFKDHQHDQNSGDLLEIILLVKFSRNVEIHEPQGIVLRVEA